MFQLQIASPGVKFPVLENLTSRRLYLIFKREAKVGKA